MKNVIARFCATVLISLMLWSVPTIESYASNTVSNVQETTTVEDGEYITIDDEEIPLSRSVKNSDKLYVWVMLIITTSSVLSGLYLIRKDKAV